MSQRSLDSPTFSSLPRRKFLRTFFFTTGASLLLGQRDHFSVLAQVSDAPNPDIGIMKIRLSDYPALGRDFGSVRIGTSARAGTSPAGLFYPVIVNRAPGPIFHALSSECTHAGCIVEILSSSTRLMTCNCHGSRFTIDGQVNRGPAGFPLLKYDAIQEGADSLRIAIPGMGFLVTVDAQPQSSNRLRLEFITFSKIQYEILFRTSLAEAWKPVPFSNSAEGNIDQLVLNGADTFSSVWVQRPVSTGFFAAAMKIRVV